MLSESCYSANPTQFGLDPHMIGYQQHPSMVAAGLVDYVPHRQPFDVTTAREKD